MATTIEVTNDLLIGNSVNIDGVECEVQAVAFNLPINPTTEAPVLRFKQTKPLGLNLDCINASVDIEFGELVCRINGVTVGDVHTQIQGWDFNSQEELIDLFDAKIIVSAKDTNTLLQEINDTEIIEYLETKNYLVAIAS